MANDGERSKRARRQSITKRQKGACKKALELATLCDLQLCIICYPPSDMASSSAASPATWPPERSKVCDILRGYLSLPPSQKKPKNQHCFSNDHPATSSPAATPAAASRGKQTAPLLPTVRTKAEGVAEAVRMPAVAIKRRRDAEERAASAMEMGTEEPLRLPCPDDMHQLLDLADLLEIRRQAVRAKITQLELWGEGDQRPSIMYIVDGR